MRSRVLTSAGPAAFAALLFLSAGSATAADPAVETTVEMTGDLEFVPATLTIQAGDTVTWRNVSPLPHTVTADTAEAQDPSHVQLPPGAEPFNSGLVQPGDSWSRTFDTPGTYTYFCIPHELTGMVATLVVE